MYWYPVSYPVEDYRQVGFPEVERMSRMMERHIAITNEILRVVRENNRILRSIQARIPGIPGPFPPRQDENQ